MKKLIRYIALFILSLILSLVVSTSIGGVINPNGKASVADAFLFYAFLCFFIDLFMNKLRMLKSSFASMKKINSLLLISVSLVSVSYQLLTINVYYRERLMRLIDNIPYKSSVEFKTSNEVLIYIIFSVFFIPIVEELLFRRLLLNFMLEKVKKYNKVIIVGVIILSSMLFAIVHGANSIDKFWAGVLFGTIYYFTDNVVYSIASHIVTNFITTVVAIICKTEFRNYMINQTSGVTNQYYIDVRIILGILLLGILVGVHYYKKHYTYDI